jgi:diamine N-acetyltransferase
LIIILIDYIQFKPGKIIKMDAPFTPGAAPFMIRPATSRDYDGFNLLFRQGDEYHASQQPDRFHPPAEPAREKEYFQGLLKDNSVAVYFAEISGELVGVLILQVREPPPGIIHRPHRFVHIDSLVVREDHRRQGIGSALMIQAENWAKTQGVGEMELNVYAFNRSAVELYEKMGYQIVLHRMGKKL